MTKMIDYRKRVTMPVRDMHADGMPIVFLVDIYGVDPRDLAVIPGAMNQCFELWSVLVSIQIGISRCFGIYRYDENR